MGVLVAMAYPTAAALKTADHTYVRCGNNGRAWSCWGGKVGGSKLADGNGSTRRANSIAEPNERAGIKCYLINGVCHQSANRILYPAETLVMNARGYWVSSAIYGPYGRPRGGARICQAPFHTHPNVSGELQECLDSAISRPASISGEFETNPPPEPRFRHYLALVRDTYSKLGDISVLGVLPPQDLTDFHATLFTHQCQYRFGDDFDDKLMTKMREIRQSVERSKLDIERAFGARQLKPKQFVEQIDSHTVAFQDEVAITLKSHQYERLFGLKQGESISLADPDIAHLAYPD